jgi:hypothetical protein
MLKMVTGPFFFLTEEIMKKLRLLVTPECNRACKGCCNDVWDLDNLPDINSYYGYSEIMLTGGEPMLYPIKLLDIILDIKAHVDVPIYLYTAKTKPPMELLMILSLIDGITLSLHEQYDVPGFLKLARILLRHPELHKKKFRLNVVSHVKLPDTYKLSPLWDVRIIEWVAPEDCPLPENEEFMKI